MSSSDGENNLASGLEENLKKSCQGDRQRSLKGRWSQALLSLLVSLIMVMSIRWLLIEPYVIPSGSMFPTLLVNDHIFVNKLAYGLRLPFSQKWILRYAQPETGEVVVFNSVDQPGVFMIKRVIGRPGDRISIGQAGQISINGQLAPVKKLSWSELKKDEMGFAREDFDPTEDYQLWKEELPGRTHLVLRLQNIESSPVEFTVPEGKLFVMGDNRERSSDSRVWGYLPFEKLLGRAGMIWFSCEKDQVNALVDCGPNEVRYQRILKQID